MSAATIRSSGSSGASRGAGPIWTPAPAPARGTTPTRRQFRVSRARDASGTSAIPTTARAALDASVTEKQFTQAVLDFARLHGWLCYHTHDSRHSAPGFPDLVLVRRDRVVWAELKSMRGRISKAQQLWLSTLAAARVLHEVYVWKPSEWNEIADVLGGSA